MSFFLIGSLSLTLSLHSLSAAGLPFSSSIVSGTCSAESSDFFFCAFLTFTKLCILLFYCWMLPWAIDPARLLKRFLGGIWKLSLLGLYAIERLFRLVCCWSDCMRSGSSFVRICTFALWLKSRLMWRGLKALLDWSYTELLCCRSFTYRYLDSTFLNLDVYANRILVDDRVWSLFMVSFDGLKFIPLCGLFMPVLITKFFEVWSRSSLSLVFVRCLFISARFGESSIPSSSASACLN